MRRDSGDDCGIRLHHALAYAGQLQHRVMVNREPAARVAKDLGLEKSQTQGAVRLLKSLQYRPSVERLALVVMRDPGLDDRDIAEIFGRSERWARAVRENAAEFMEAEQIDPHLEFLDDGLQPGDPTPSEIIERATEIRESGVFRNRSPVLCKSGFQNAALQSGA